MIIWHSTEIIFSNKIQVQYIYRLSSFGAIQNAATLIKRFIFLPYQSLIIDTKCTIAIKNTIYHLLYGVVSCTNKFLIYDTRSRNSHPLPFAILDTNTQSIRMIIWIPISLVGVLNQVVSLISRLVQCLRGVINIMGKQSNQFVFYFRLWLPKTQPSHLHHQQQQQHGHHPPTSSSSLRCRVVVGRCPLKKGSNSSCNICRAIRTLLFRLTDKIINCRRILVGCIK